VHRIAACVVGEDGDSTVKSKKPRSSHFWGARLRTCDARPRRSMMRTLWSIDRPGCPTGLRRRRAYAWRSRFSSDSCSAGV